MKLIAKKSTDGISAGSPYWGQAVTTPHVFMGEHTCFFVYNDKAAWKHYDPDLFAPWPDEENSSDRVSGKQSVNKNQESK